MSDHQSLQKLNYANVVAYILNTLVTYGVGVSGRFPTNGELSAKYQTLVTPAGFAFAIWGIIFTAELIWCTVQLLPRYRSKAVVLQGVGFNYVYACLAQVSWTLCFTTEYIALSLISMVSILIPLVLIVNKTSKISNDNISDYWLLKFPFEIHAGWIMAATLVNTNVFLVAYQASPSNQIVAAWFSLFVLASAAVYYISKKKWVVPCVLVWASNAIRLELSSPKDSIASAFPTETIQSVRDASGVLAAIILATTVAAAVYGHFSGPDDDEIEIQTGANREPFVDHHQQQQATSS
ncbi:unnamed protein product [Cylindrotheca closterium]|uniref:Uncharacterized protein n=1 Tax=Cylindrotheca closterium TaxID=2856 RepID=A0AAD2FRY5_9STRA|nr:unnamed protein product [Cylindrotheca closterium]